MASIIPGVSILAGAFKGFGVAANLSKPSQEQKQHNPYLLPFYYALSTPFVSGRIHDKMLVNSTMGIEHYKQMAIKTSNAEVFLAACVWNAVLIGVGYQVGKLGHEALQ
jgi:hypothetical protein